MMPAPWPACRALSRLGERELAAVQGSVYSKPARNRRLLKEPQAARTGALQAVEKLVTGDEPGAKPSHMRGQGLHVDPIQPAAAQLVDEVQQCQLRGVRPPVEHAL